MLLIADEKHKMNLHALIQGFVIVGRACKPAVMLLQVVVLLPLVGVVLALRLLGIVEIKKTR